MSGDKTANTRNTSPDDLTKTKGAGQPELKEEELDKVSGGEFLKVKVNEVY